MVCTSRRSRKSESLSAFATNSLCLSLISQGSVLKSFFEVKRKETLHKSSRSLPIFKQWKKLKQKILASKFLRAVLRLLAMHGRCSGDKL